MGVTEAFVLADALQNNETLTKLNLQVNFRFLGTWWIICKYSHQEQHNLLGDDGLERICEALKGNNTLTKLNLVFLTLPLFDRLSF